jgi:hypothetical protein
VIVKNKHAPKGTVFINVPFDAKFERSFIAIISGLVALGFIPHSALEVRSTTDRLHKIFDLIQRCEFSIHDLSRVELSATSPRCPRFNMPFEAGLAIALNLAGAKHECAFFEAKQFRLQKSLSDLNGYDPYLHGNRVKGVLAAVLDLFESSVGSVNSADLFYLYRMVSRDASIIKKQNGNDLFRASSFRQLVYQSQIWARDLGYIP